MAQIEPRYFFREDGLALDVSREKATLDRSFHRALRIAMDPSDSWYQSKSNRRRAREMALARDYWSKNEDAFVRDVISKTELEESASWTFIYCGQIEKLPPLYRKRSRTTVDDSFKFVYPSDFEGSYQIEFSDRGIRMKKRVRLYIRGGEVLPINQDPKWLESVRLFKQPPSHIGAEWSDHIMDLGDEFALTVVDRDRRQTRDVYGDLEPVDVCVFADNARAFLKWTSGDLLRASLHRHPDRPQQKFLVIRSLNRPTLWTPSPTQQVTQGDALPIYPDAAAHLKLISDLRMTNWAAKHGYLPKL